MSGSIKGLKVDAVIRDMGVFTYLEGPVASAPTEYDQFFNGEYDADTKATKQFAVSTPSAVVSAAMFGSVGVTAPAVGIYPRSCSEIRFVMSLPIPPDVVCTPLASPCEPQCQRNESGRCEPALPGVQYIARGPDQCFSAPTALGEWRLELTSVCSRTSTNPRINFDTHGHLSATLVNPADVSDTASLTLDF